MKKNILESLICPYCGSGFSLNQDVNSNQDELLDAIIECGCRESLILKGILVINNLEGEIFMRATAALKIGKPEEAFLILLRGEVFFDRVLRSAKLSGLPFVNLLSNARTVRLHASWEKIIQSGSFLEMVEKLPVSDFSAYLKYRFSGASFLSSVPLIMSIDELPGPVLELGCGMGHHSFLFSVLYPGRKLILADAELLHLFMAKKFFAPDAECVCCDMNNPLPFARDYFGAVFSSDALHYVHSKRVIFQEIKRVLFEDGMLLFSHLHNRLQNNPVAGAPLSKEGWLGLMDFPWVRISPEETVLKQFILEGRFDLTKEAALAELEASSAFLGVAASNDRLSKQFLGLDSRYFSLPVRLMINPLYKVERFGAKVMLSKKWGSELIRGENSFIDKFMPESVCLESSLVDDLNKEGIVDSEKLIGLRKKQVLIGVPEKY